MTIKVDLTSSEIQVNRFFNAYLFNPFITLVYYCLILHY